MIAIEQQTSANSDVAHAHSIRVCMMNDNYYRSSGIAVQMKRIFHASSEVDYIFAGCYDKSGEEDFSWIPEGRYQRFDLKTKDVAKIARELSRFKQWQKEEGFELVHCFHRRLTVLLQIAGIRVLYTAQLVFPYARWFRWFSPRYTTAVTPSVARNLVETTGHPPLACIGNPVDFPEQAPEITIDVQPLKAVCVARLDPVKAQTHLISAWKILYDKGYRFELDLVGEGPLRPALEAQVRSNSLEALIHFRGYSRDVNAIIGESLFAVLVSEFEGQGIVTLEAAAMGRPSLLTAVPGSIDLIPPDKKLPNGLAFGDVRQLADALEVWFTSPELVRQEGQRFFAFLRETSNPATIVRNYRRVYEQVLGAAR